MNKLLSARLFNPTKLASTIALLGASVVAQAAPTLTEFTLNTGVTGVATGTFSIGSPFLANTGHLAGAGNTYNYASQLFTPSASGSYTFGMSSAPVDTVLILYQGSYNSASPSTNAVNVNDDSDGLGAGGVTMGTCGGDAGLCPKMTENLTGATDYYVVITTFGAGAPITLPIGFYVFGEPVGVGGAPATPTISVLNSSTILVNSPAYGGAQVIDNTPALLQLFTDAGLSTDEELSGAASQTLPLLTGGSTIAVSNSLAGMNRVIQARLASNLGMSSGDGFALDDRHIWLKPFGSWADQDDRNGVSGFDADTWGVVAGIDGVLTDWRLGLAFGYANTDVDSNSSVAPQSADIDVYQLIGYGSKNIAENTEFNFQIDFGKNNNDGSRTISFTNTVATSSFDSDTFHIGAGVSHQYPIDAANIIVASVRGDYSQITNDAYTETGAGLLNLSVNEQSTESMVISIEGKLIHKINEESDVTAKVGVGYDTINEQASITSTYAGALTSAFVTNGIDPDPWTAHLGLGYVRQVNDMTSLTANYDAEYREDFLNQTASVNVRWAF